MYACIFVWAHKHYRNINDIPVGGSARRLKRVKVQSCLLCCHLIE